MGNKKLTKYTVMFAWFIILVTGLAALATVCMTSYMDAFLVDVESHFVHSPASCIEFKCSPGIT